MAIEDWRLTLNQLEWELTKIEERNRQRDWIMKMSSLESELRKIEERNQQLNQLRFNGSSTHQIRARDQELKEVNDGNLFVRGLDKWATHLSLFEIFSPFGAIRSCKVAVDSDGLAKGYGLVQFYSAESVKKAIKYLNGTLMNGNRMLVVPLVAMKVEENTAIPTKVGIQVRRTSIPVVEETIIAGCTDIIGERKDPEENTLVKRSNLQSEVILKHVFNTSEEEGERKENEKNGERNHVNFSQSDKDVGLQAMNELRDGEGELTSDRCVGEIVERKLVLDEMHHVSLLVQPTSEIVQHAPQSIQLASQQVQHVHLESEIVHLVSRSINPPWQPLNLAAQHVQLVYPEKETLSVALHSHPCSKEEHLRIKKEVEDKGGGSFLQNPNPRLSDDTFKSNTYEQRNTLHLCHESSKENFPDHQLTKAVSGVEERKVAGGEEEKEGRREKELRLANVSLAIKQMHHVQLKDEERCIDGCVSSVGENRASEANQIVKRSEMVSEMASNLQHTIQQMQPTTQMVPHSYQLMYRKEQQIDKNVNFQDEKRRYYLYSEIGLFNDSDKSINYELGNSLNLYRGNSESEKREK